jgi:hypothetical protein
LKGIGRSQVEKHLETCADCRLEIKLLRTLTAEPVPDPGEAFWAAMPERIYRNVQKMQEKKRLIDISSLWNRMLFRDGHGASRLSGLVLMVTLLIVKPSPKEIPESRQMGTMLLTMNRPSWTHQTDRT